MKRLDFMLPDFARLSWVSYHARQVWEPRINGIIKACLEIEWLSVESGIRPCCITLASAEELSFRAAEWARHGLCAMPVEEVQVPSNHLRPDISMQAQLKPAAASRIVIGAPREVVSFRGAWDDGDHSEIGRLLGCPPCCHEFFRRVWVDQNLIDTTWAMAVATAALPNRERIIEVTGPSEANILWRWMGIRAVPHLPCRFDCEPTVKLGGRFVQVGRQAGYNEEMDWLLEILTWPIEWSGLHGIAEIKTPVLKVCTRTDATAEKYVVRRLGNAYPAEGARAPSFPYRTPRQPLLTHSRGFRRGFDHPIGSGDDAPVRRREYDNPSESKNLIRSDGGQLR